MMRGFIGLGSNIEPRIAHLRIAVQNINRIPNTCVMRISSLYETEPIGVSEPQAWYLNAVVEIETELSPFLLLEALEAIERELGRCTHSKGTNAPRTIDLDLLLLDDIQIETDRL
ncbi:MAG TPA: 2-amino-4-hydroxy-6-hydroxymethyldihydropteridine diphosphokinase, partial [Armatimonadetes bacterium]|nr:2-amino-4-hydroxy-6-hydroxymethyldihydropteridine diphosphokinase [Armatimonadota bacterium]